MIKPKNGYVFRDTITFPFTEKPNHRHLSILHLNLFNAHTHKFTHHFKWTLKVLWYLITNKFKDGTICNVRCNNSNVCVVRYNGDWPYIVASYYYGIKLWEDDEAHIMQSLCSTMANYYHLDYIGTI